MYDGVFSGKIFRLCMECKSGLLIADSNTYEKQDIFCIACGTKHKIKRYKKGILEVRKTSKKCSEEERQKLVQETENIITEFANAIREEKKELS